MWPLTSSRLLKKPSTTVTAGFHISVAYRANSNRGRHIESGTGIIDSPISSAVRILTAVAHMTNFGKQARERRKTTQAYRGGNCCFRYFSDCRGTPNRREESAFFFFLAQMD